MPVDREFELIEAIAQRWSAAGLPVGPGDDCAWLPPIARPVVTVDACVDGVHFHRRWATPKVLGARVLLAALSDLSAAAARPVAALLQLSVGQEWDARMLLEAVEGMAEIGEATGLALAGGDVVRTPGATSFSLTLLGEAVDARGPWGRGEAEPGHALVLTGCPGLAALGLAALQGGLADDPELRAACEAFLRPPNHLPLSLALAEAGLRPAAIDLSDGLSGDSQHLAARSGVELRIHRAALPQPANFAAAARRCGAEADALQWHGGESFELLLALAPGELERARGPLDALAPRWAVVGEVHPARDAGSAALLLDPSGRPLSPRGSSWEHRLG
jgi:thiamine-monophosphate kinase